MTETIIKSLEPTIDKYVAVAKKEITSALILQVLLYTGITFILVESMRPRKGKS